MRSDVLEIPSLATWVIDVRDLVPEFAEDAPAPAKRRAAFTRASHPSRSPLRLPCALIPELSRTLEELSV